MSESTLLLYNAGESLVSLTTHIALGPGERARVRLPAGVVLVDEEPGAKPTDLEAGRAQLLVEVLGSTGRAGWIQVQEQLTMRGMPVGSAAQRALQAAVDQRWVEVGTPRKDTAVAGRPSPLVHLTVAGRTLYEECTGCMAAPSEWDRLIPSCGQDPTRIYLAVTAREALMREGWLANEYDPLSFTRDGRRARLQVCCTLADLDLRLDLPAKAHPTSLYVVCVHRRGCQEVRRQIWDWVDHTKGVGYVATLRDLARSGWMEVRASLL